MPAESGAEDVVVGALDVRLRPRLGAHVAALRPFALHPDPLLFQRRNLT